ncbi:hypothetical protein F4802DRAFT_540806 [Xylaria palmicola]|nr:hypothetical protein F4802DRAFT_540806 [Xylaria palmicola]
MVARLSNLVKLSSGAALACILLAQGIETIGSRRSQPQPHVSASFWKTQITTTGVMISTTTITTPHSFLRNVRDFWRAGTTSLRCYAKKKDDLRRILRNHSVSDKRYQAPIGASPVIRNRVSHPRLSSGSHCFWNDRITLMGLSLLLLIASRTRLVTSPSPIILRFGDCG